MKKGTTILLLLYGIAMVSHGSLEMVHDLLHYLAAHHHSHLHDHGHSHHHHFSDHQQHDDGHHHTHIHHDNNSEPQPETTTYISFFLFCERKPAFCFLNGSFSLLKFNQQRNIGSPDYSPDTPPPQTVI